MSTLEEEIVRPLKEQLALRTSNGHSVPPVSRPSPKLRWWHHAIASLLIFAVSLGVCGVFQLKSLWGNSWSAANREFQWLVFVHGDSLAVDEVGRFLKQIDGTREVIYQSPEDSMQRFRGEKLAGPLDLLGSNPFPPAWRVTWNANVIGSAHMQDALQDTLALPGVADVAYDTSLIEKLRTYRLQWLQSKWILSAVAAAGILLFILTAGFLLSRAPFSLGTRKSLIFSFALDVVCWAAGFGVVYLALGVLPWVLLAGGVAAAVIRWMTFTALRTS